MLEPVAAVIFNTVLSGRSHFERFIPRHSVVKIVQTVSPRPLSSTFFNPQPRRVKGKSRAVDDEHDSSVLLFSRCREWSLQTRNCISAYRRNQAVLMKDAFYSKQRLHRRTAHSKGPSISVHRNTSSPQTLVRSIQAVQKRHASGMTDASSPDDPPLVSSSSAEGEQANDDGTAASIPNSTLAIEKLLSLNKSPDLMDPDEAWSAYVEIEKADALSRLSVSQLLTFADKIFSLGDAHYNSTQVELGRLFVWGERAKSLLSSVAGRIAPFSRYDHWLKCGMARAAALTGQVDESLSLIHAAQKIPMDSQDVRILWTYRTLVFYMYRYYDATHVLTMLAKEWLSVGSYLLKSSGQWHIGDSQLVGASFRKGVQRLLSRIPRPAVLLSSHFTHWGPEMSKRIGELLIDSYCNDHFTLHAVDTFYQLKKLNVPVTLDTHLRLIRALVQDDTLGLAKDLFSLIPRGTTYKYYLQTALYLFAHCGDHLRAESYFHSLNLQNVINEQDIAMLMHSYGTQGLAERVNIMFDKFFPIQSNGQRTNNPNIQHYGVAIYSCAKGGKIDDINRWLGEMVENGHKLNVVIYNMIMQAFARSGNMSALRTVLEQLKESKTPPTVVTYIQLMTALAHRRDIAGVEALYKEAVQDQGVVPNIRMVNTLMNAHVMAGSWKGVIRVFDYIRSESHPRIRLTIEIYTTLIKAYVLIGAPFAVVSKIFYKLEDLNVKADTYTFALLIQSACDAGEMAIASDIFHEMDKIASHWDSNIHIDVYILTIIMAGYIRAGKRREAKAVYDEMVNRQIQPTAVTFSVMLTSYANQRSEEALKIAEDFISSLMKVPERPWDTPPYGKPSALELVYGPVLEGYARLRKAEDVERLLEQYLEGGGVESLGTLTALFDVYRRTFQFEKVKEMWPTIFALGVEHSQQRIVVDSTKHDPTVDRLLNNVLCVPLSIYIDALSSAGEHEEIARVWREFQDQGFSFDAHNWNHLAVALVRAGQLERAFQMVENVILPYQDQARELIASRMANPKTPFMFDTNSQDKDEELGFTVLESQAQLWKRGHDRHSSVKRNERQAMRHLEDEDESHQDDVAWPMHVLHQISPAWNVWKIHTAVMDVLLQSIEQLRQGYVPQPVQRRQEELGYVKEYEEEDGNSKEEATRLFRRLYAEYPRTRTLLNEYEERQRARLGLKYEKTYENYG
ncbi:hypothetical protein D9757_001285 [Collybiopsis confluens]|uniref:Pentatricopeptide repeat-containing protein n=1 Tax=Collybiopsis confluens TaxID=2823264 RepID=A0A8H5I0R7_9AGAR|nr:hypothetical protein D9757_001285 [Collybiopsis confluens]